MDVVPVQKGLGVLARPDATAFYLLSNSAEAEPQQEWYRNFDLAAERYRGLNDREDHFLAGIFRARLAPGKPVTFVLSTDADAPLDGGAALDARAALEEKSLELLGRRAAASRARRSAVDSPDWSWPPRSSAWPGRLRKSRTRSRSSRAITGSANGAATP